MNNLIRAANVWLAEQIGLKKAEHRKENEPKWNVGLWDVKRS